MKQYFTIFTFLLTASLQAQTPDHLVISEIAVQPTAGEFIEIYNPTSQTINLSNYYLTDATNPSSGFYYYNLPDTNAFAGTGSADFLAKFPNVDISAGEYKVVSLKPATDFNTTYGMNPDFEMQTSGTVGVDLMLPGFANGTAIQTNAGLSNAGEIVILFHWDGASDLVQDVDYLVWGDKAEAVDKTGISIDGPDADTVSTTFANDTEIANQIPVSSATHAIGNSWQRFSDASETGESQTGGNGITSHDETSEALSASFGEGIPTPKAPSTISPPGADGSGTVTLSPETVETSTATTLIFTLTGTVGSPITDVSIDLPTSWTFDGNSSSVSLSGSGTVGTTSATQVNVTGANITTSAQLEISIANLTSPISSENSIFTVKTAGVAGTLTEIAAQPSIAVSLDPTAPIPIADIRNNFSTYNGQTVTIEAVVTVPFGVLRNDRIDTYLQDDSGFGINVYRGSDGGTTFSELFVRGNKLQILGRVTEFSGTKEIELQTNSTVTLISSGNALPEPKPFTASALISEIATYEGTWVQLVGVVDEIAGPFGGGYSVSLRGNSDSETFDARVWEVSGIDPNLIFTVGDTVTVNGIADQFNGALQIPIADTSDVTLGGEFTEPPADLVSDGAGIVTIENVFLDLGFSGDLEITISGAGPDTASITQVSMTIPQEVTFTDAILSGDAFFGLNAAINGQEILISNAKLSEGQTGILKLIGTNFPSTDQVISFATKTALTNGTLTATESNPVFILGTGSPNVTNTLAEIQDDEESFEGANLTIVGVITYDQGLISSLSETWVQDASGRGVNIFDSQINGFKRGAVVTISGQIENYLSGSASNSDLKTTEITNLTSVTQHGKLGSIESILNLATFSDVTAQNGQNHFYEGTVFKTRFTVLTVPSTPIGGGFNVQIADTLGSELTLRVWESTGIVPSSIFVVGKVYDGILMVDVFRTDPQLILGYASDVKEFVIDTSKFPDFGLRLKFNGVMLHSLNQKFDIEYQVPSRGKTKIRIFDLKGRSVATLVDSEEGGESNIWKTVSWKGTNDGGERQPMGVYICHYVFTDFNNGKTQKKVIPLVIGTKF